MIPPPRQAKFTIEYLHQRLFCNTVSEEDLCDRSILLSSLWAAFMNRDTLLIVLTAAGSALCWWPAAIEPSIDFPRWILLVLVALITGLSTILSNGRWLRFVVASTVGAFAGLWTGLVLFPPSDGIAGSYAPMVFAVATIAAFVVSLLAGLLGRNLSASRKTLRGSVWLAFVSCVAFGPIALALRPPLVGHRVTTNDRMAAERFESLKNAVEETVAQGGDPARICDGENLKRHYSGPAFSDQDWKRITGNYVTQDGYVFMVYCREKDGYKIDAWPARGKADGTRRFCTDKSGKIGYRMEWNHVCVACTK